jgi:hypothetical protein
MMTIMSTGCGESDGGECPIDGLGHNVPVNQHGSSFG